MVRTLVLIALASAACGDTEHRSEPAAAPGTVTSAFSRSALAVPLGAVSGDPLGLFDPAARSAFLASVPPPPSAAASTKLGTETGLEQTSATPSTATSATPPAVVGAVETIRRSASGIERILRASAYAQLVERCRDDRGGYLPAEAVELSFVIDETGRIAPSTITAKVKDAIHERAALCMIRELGAIDVRAPAATRGERTLVTTTVPSVD